MTLEKAKENIGRIVIYTPYKGCPNRLKQRGIVTHANDKYAFVRYGGDIGAKATKVDDLELENEI